MQLSNLDTLALTVYGEARNQPVEGKIAVANVCRNRLKTNRWGASYESVCLAPMQFSCWSPKGGLNNYTTLKALSQQIAGGKMPDDPVLKECYAIAQGVMSGAFQDNTEKATHYFVTATSQPSWARQHVPVCVIGAHSFFSGIA